ncbi:MAG: M48 family metallopeptidase [Nitrospira sp.]|nr:M48 family metallopeptidase [Nitrospira sp.]MBP0121990.1 M48 family metallopeptidase [Nitrospira sp.]MBP0127489.1 M48 family metallopeptidase [Nitrospira sp.]MBP0130419.1 M48 family metallopeptidase [Nitrospira sp.]
MSSNALCFGHNHPASGAPCFVQVDEAGLTIILESTGGGGDREVVPFAALSVSAGGLDHDHLVVKWTGVQGEQTLYLKDQDAIRAFRQTAPDDLSLHFAQAAELVRQVRQRRRLVWGLALGMFLSTVLGLWFGSDLLVQIAVSRIPVEWEQKLGESAYRDFLAQQEVMKEGPAVAALGEMTQRLTEQIPNNPYKFEITVVKSDVINAFALPGGHVVVFTGLMKKADSGEEVAGVMSHELNHVLRRHGLERIVKSLGLLTVVTIVLGDQQGLVGMMKQLSVELLTLKFGREQETEADVTGLQLLQRAKIDPSGMIKFFERLSEKDEGRMEWLSTHPMSTARAERLKAELAALPKKSPEPFTFDWKQVQASLGAQPVVAP